MIKISLQSGKGFLKIIANKFGGYMYIMYICIIKSIEMGNINLITGNKYYDSIYKGIEYVGKIQANTDEYKFKLMSIGHFVFLSEFEVRSLKTMTELSHA